MRVLPSINWTNDLVTDALKQNPGPPYKAVQLVTAAMFDNYTAHVNYSAQHTADSQGERLDMTNWASAAIPLCTLPNPNMDFSQVSTFRPNFDKYSVVALCHPQHPTLTQYKTTRWQHSFAAIKAGTYFNRPSYQPPVAQHLMYREPIWDRLQSSYDDVEAELNIMRTHPSHVHSRFMFVGGDGLAINRINWTIAKNFPKYLYTSPAIIPIQGEHPHGTCHILHMGWRPYSPLLLPIMTAIGHSELKADFSVSDFNDYDFGICILIEGIAQYFIELEASGGPPLALLVPFMAACAVNIDLEWLSMFLQDFGFMYWDMRQSVRSNDSATIDLIWREAVRLLHAYGRIT